jgi:hypothetical protein
MAGEPNICIWIAFGDILVQILGCVVVMRLLVQSLPDASGIAGIAIALAIADLLPSVMPSLTTTTRTKQVVVQFIISSRVSPIEDGHRCALQPDDNGAVLLVCKDMSSQSVLFPTKVIGIVESTLDILPIASIWFFGVCVLGHLRKRNHCCLVCVVWPADLINSPRRGWQSHGVTVVASIIQQSVDGLRPSIYHALNIGRDSSCSQLSLDRRLRLSVIICNIELSIIRDVSIAV